MGFKNRKRANIWLIKSPEIYDNRVYIINEKEKGWNDSPKWLNKNKEEVGSLAFPWPVFIQQLVSDGIKPLAEIFNVPSEGEEIHISEWRFDKKNTIYQAWLLGWDIEDYQGDIEEQIYSETAENKILILEFAFEVSKRVGIGLYIKRYSKFLKILLEEIKNDENKPKILADIVKAYLEDWDEINNADQI